MKVVEVKEIQTEWFNHLIDDCHDIIIEAEFTSRWALVEGYHALGTPVSYTHLTLPTIYSV